MKLLALLIAFAISHFISKPEKFRNFSWLHKLKQWVVQKKLVESADINMLLVLFIPIAIVQLFIQLVFDSTLGYFIASIMVLIYCIGPENLEESFQVNEISEEVEESKNPEITSQMTRLSLYRWFSVFFWYVVLGVVGVLLYRFTERLWAENNKGKMSDSLNKLMRILNYPVAWIMVIALAIASDFERIYKKCKPHMTLDNIKSMDDQFLYNAMEFAVENCEVDENHQESMEQITLKVLKRMLVVCLVFISILVILAI